MSSEPRDPPPSRHDRTVAPSSPAPGPVVRVGGVSWPTVAMAAVVVVALVVMPFVVSPRGLLVAQRMVILGLFGVAFNVVFGAADMPSLGHAGLLGIGSYATGLGLARWDWSMAAVLVVAVVAGTVAGVVYGIATLRTRGIHLLLLTLAIAQALWGLAFQQVRLTGGDNGIADIDRSGLTWFGSGVAGFYWSALLVALVAIGLLWWFDRSSLGTVVRAVGMSPSRLQALGYDVRAVRVGAFAVSGAFSALAGVLYALSLRFVGPDHLGWQLSAEVMLFAILGGAAWFAGPLLGAAIVLGAEVVLTDLTDRWMLVLGVLYVVTMLFMPRGVLGVVDRWRRDRRDDATPPTTSASDPVDTAHTPGVPS